MERDIAKTCPLCGKDNRCGLLGQNPTEPCWCTQEVFPSKLLERVPEDSKGKACICRECLEKFHLDQ